ncbi:MAG: helix-turn-helix domain-containing protein [Thermoplasmata archaeon]
MGRKVTKEICKVCGKQARKINYTSKAKGRTYRYYKFVHSNGVTHYFRLKEGLATQDAGVIEPKVSIFDSLENVLDVKADGRELTFTEIKSSLDKSYGRPVSTATVYRNINKMLRLDLISKREDGNSVLYSKKTKTKYLEGETTTNMSIGFDFTGNRVLVTQFVHIKNLGLKLINSFPVSLPIGVIDSPDQIDLIAFDETKKITVNKDCITYSYIDQTGISITLSRALRKSEEANIFLNYSLSYEDKPINIFIPSDLNYLKVNCEVVKGKDIVIKKKLGDGLKEIEPMLVRRTGTDLGHTIVEAEFENTFRGDAIIISANGYK